MQRIRSAPVVLALLVAAAPPLPAQAGFDVVQTFTAPAADSYLQALYIDSFSTANADILFKIVAWDGSLPTGPALFSVLMNDLHVEEGELALQPGLLLEGGGMYGLVIDLVLGAFSLYLDRHDSVPGGAFYQCNHDGAEYTGCTPHLFEGATVDIVGFRPDFTAPPPTVVPEPASLALLGTGLAGLAGAARRRRRKEPV